LDFADPDEAFFENSLVVSANKRRSMTIGHSKRGLIVVVFVTLGRSRERHQHAPGKSARKEAICQPLERKKLTRLVTWLRSATIPNGQ
jgi:hypothetical protein